MRVRTGVVAGVGALGLVVTLSSPASAAGNTEHFLAVQTTASAHALPLAATGPIHARGTDTPLSNTRDRFTFARGNLIIVHHRTSGTQHFDPKTCVAQFSEQGTYRVESGTAAYAHAAGHGTYAVTGIVFGCDQSKPPQAISVTIRAAGPLTL
jgi:hypothetical protein